MPPKVRISCPLAASHSSSVLSELPESRRVPSGENATETQSVAALPLEGADQLPACGVPQSERPVVAPPESRRVPSGENATDRSQCGVPHERFAPAARLPRPTA